MQIPEKLTKYYELSVHFRMWSHCSLELGVNLDGICTKRFHKSPRLDILT